MTTPADGKLSDANKESIKELLSTFRTLFALNVSGVSLVFPMKLRGDLLVSRPYLFSLSASLGVISALVMVYLFLVALRKIHAGEGRIIYQAPIVASSTIAFALLTGAIVTFILSI